MIHPGTEKKLNFPAKNTVLKFKNFSAFFPNFSRNDYRQFICIIVDSNRVQVTLFLTLPSSNENARNKKKMQRPPSKLQSAYIRKSHFFKITTFYSYNEKVSQKFFKIFCESFESMNMILLLTIYVKSEIQD